MNLNITKSEKDLISNAPSHYWPKSYKRSVQRKVKKNQKFNSVSKPIYKKFTKIYYSSFWEFMPLFIGWLISFVRINLTYGRIRSTSCFNKKVYKNFKKKIIFCNFIHIIFGPVIFILILCFQPLFVIDSKNFLESWNNLFLTIFMPGDFASNVNNGLEQFMIDIVVPTYNSNAWFYGLILIALVPIFNFSQIFSSLILNWHSKNYIKTLVTEDSLKIKISRLRKSKLVL